MTSTYVHIPTMVPQPTQPAQLIQQQEPQRENFVATQEETAYVMAAFFGNNREKFLEFLVTPEREKQLTMKTILKFFKERGRKNLKLTGNKPELSRLIKEIFGQTFTSTTTTTTKSPATTVRAVVVQPPIQQKQQQQQQAASQMDRNTHARIQLYSGESSPLFNIQKACQYQKEIREQEARMSQLQQQCSVFQTRQMTTTMADALTWENSDFTLRQDPFFKVERRLFAQWIEPFQANTTQLFHFSIDSLLGVALSRREKFVHVRFFDLKEGVDIEPLDSWQLFVNKSSVLLPAMPKKRRTKNLKPMITSRKVDISNYIRVGGNSVQFRVPITSKAIFVLQSVSKLSLNSILLSIPHSSFPQQKQQQSNSTTAGDDIDFCVRDYKLSLQCPLSLAKIVIPAKGGLCTHQRCFDLKTYLEFCSQNGLWECPICCQNLPMKSLVVDEWFQKALRSVESEEMFVIVHSDGTISRIDNTRPESVPPQSNSPNQQLKTTPMSTTSLENSNNNSITVFRSRSVQPNQTNVVLLIDDSNEEEETTQTPPVITTIEKSPIRTYSPERVSATPQSQRPTLLGFTVATRDQSPSNQTTTTTTTANTSTNKNRPNAIIPSNSVHYHHYHHHYHHHHRHSQNQQNSIGDEDHPIVLDDDENNDSNDNCSEGDGEKDDRNGNENENEEESDNSEEDSYKNDDWRREYDDEDEDDEEFEEEEEPPSKRTNY